MLDDLRDEVKNESRASQDTLLPLGLAVYHKLWILAFLEASRGIVAAEQMKNT